jgi:iron complex outermembrane receptor protein
MRQSWKGARNGLWKGASRSAMLAGLAAVGAGLGAPAVFAQAEQITAPQQGGQEDRAPERVVVIGSLLAGAAEDAPSPVEVFTAEDLQDQGAPNIIEFTRNLAISSEAFGAPDVNLASTASGFSNVNLRGLGAARTMTLLNGHRTSVDTSFLPMNAIGRVEVLKDGAGVTYGAGAVAGVINFDGVELSAQHKIIDGSDGETELSALIGFNGDYGNILLSAMYAHQSPLNFTARDYGQLPWEVNPTQYVEFAANPGTFHQNGGFTALRDYDTASCAAVGGVQPNSTTTCYYYYTPFFNFIDEQTNLRLFGSGDFDVSDTNTAGSATRTSICSMTSCARAMVRPWRECRTPHPGTC